MDRGTFIERDGRPAVRFQRTYPHPVERVWAAVTEPDELAQWFPSSVKIEPCEGGTIAFADDPDAEPASGTILIMDPPRRLASRGTATSCTSSWSRPATTAAR